MSAGCRVSLTPPVTHTCGVGRDMLSSSSLSSAGESDGLDDPGVYTNDEGREGDDEQSDWYHEPTDEPAERTAGHRPVRPAAAAAAAAGPIKVRPAAAGQRARVSGPGYY